jgi:phosphatidylglycerophosphate synthase
MALSRAAAITLISLSRIPLALAFVAILAPRPTNVLLCIGFTAAALITDVADGFFARRLGIATVRGRHWDSLGDKSFYMAVDVAFISNGVLLSTLVIPPELALDDPPAPPA